MDSLDGEDLPPPAYEAALLAYRHSLRRVPTQYGHGGPRRPSGLDWETASTSTSSASREEDSASSSSLSGTGLSEKQRMGRFYLANAESSTPLPSQDSPPAMQHVPIQPLRPRRRGPRSLPGLPPTVEEVPVVPRVVPASPPPPISPIQSAPPSPLDNGMRPVASTPLAFPSSRPASPLYIRPAPPLLSKPSLDNLARPPRQSLYEDESTPVATHPTEANSLARQCAPKVNSFYNSSVAAHMSPARPRDPLPRTPSNGVVSNDPYERRLPMASHSTASFASLPPARPSSSLSTSSHGSYTRTSHYEASVR